MQTDRSYANYIGGRWVTPSAARFAADVNPADTREELGRFPESGETDMALAIEAAERALPGWRRTLGPRRAAILERAAAILERRADEVSRALTLEMGKTIGEARGEVARGVSTLRFFAGEPLRPAGETFSASRPATLLYTERVPLGVVGVITPWNFPVAIPIWKLAPCLAYGNTAVFKPAELTPLTAHLVTEVLVEAGLPEGVLNVVHGAGAVVGEALARDPRVHGITFTGSNAVGRRIAQIAAERGAPAQLELGGKNPLVVAPDADLDEAAEIAVSGAMRSAGQKCTATSRVIVLDEIARRFTDALVDRVRTIKVGPGIDPESYMGPVVSGRQRESILHYVEIARAEGARLLTGGHALSGEPYDHGYYVAPTVFADVEPAMRIAQEEVFGPVVGVTRVPSMREAIGVANDVRFGLSASIVTRDIRAALEFVREVDAGVLHVNSGTAGGDYYVPFGGMKASSSHSREQGRAAMEFFTQIKTVYVDPPSAE